MIKKISIGFKARDNILPLNSATRSGECTNLAHSPNLNKK